MQYEWKLCADLKLTRYPQDPLSYGHINPLGKGLKLLEQSIFAKITSNSRIQNLQGNVQIKKMQFKSRA